jgi:CBS domain containing-hemolysin-like protein
MRLLRKRRRGEGIREAIEELIEERPELGDSPSDEPALGSEERGLLANILSLRAKNVADVMVPRVDIVGISVDTPLEETVKLIQQEAHSRYPVASRSTT